MQRGNSELDCMDDSKSNSSSAQREGAFAQAPSGTSSGRARAIHFQEPAVMSLPVGANDNSLFQENRAYEYGHPQTRWQQSQQMQQQQEAFLVGAPSSMASSIELSVSAQTRSNPITIVRPPSEARLESANYETDDDEDSVVDVVERDAIRLRRQYGDKVVATASSYKQQMVGPDSSAASILSKTMLKAPYLGSLSKSENFLMDLPPISLSQDVYSYEVEPPTEITSYGSLRESHQRGKFLDGPSSYREPRSGQIRRLDDRQRYRIGGKLSSSQPPTMSIGERMQQARINKEARAKKIEGSNGSSSVKSSAEAASSSLSAMMNEASNTPEKEMDNSIFMEPLKFSLPPSALETNGLRTTASEDAELNDQDASPTMMSTSLTAFEILNSSASNIMAGYQNNHTQRFVQLQQQNTVAAATAAAASAVGDAPSLLPPESVIRDQQFQPLARSLSDPTPHHLQRRPVLASQSGALGTINSPPVSGGVASFSIAGVGLGPSAANQSVVPGGDISVVHHTMYAYPTVPGAGAPSSGQTPPHSGHNLESDAAFDMDME